MIGETKNIEYIQYVIYVTQTIADVYRRTFKDEKNVRLCDFLDFLLSKQLKLFARYRKAVMENFCTDNMYKLDENADYDDYMDRKYNFRTCPVPTLAIVSAIVMKHFGHRHVDFETIRFVYKKIRTDS